MADFFSTVFRTLGLSTGALEAAGFGTTFDVFEAFVIVVADFLVGVADFVSFLRFLVFFCGGV